MAVRIIVGLGNPGSKYQGTRHNAGFYLVDALAQHAGAKFRVERKLHGESCTLELAGQSVLLLKPTTFMNHSGTAVQAALQYYKIDASACLVVHDDMDLPPGVARLKYAGGHGGHNGLRDIMAKLGHGDFQRLRIGIGHPGSRDQVLAWVLGRPGRADEDAMVDALAHAMDVLPLLAEGQVDKAMQQLHTRVI